MPYSPLKIWLHPRFTARIMESLEEEAASGTDRTDTLARELEAAAEREKSLREAMEALAAEAGTLRAERLVLESRIAASEAHVKALEEENARLQRETEGQEDAREMLAQFESKLDGFLRIKAGYEDRIARLRATVKKLKGLMPVPDPEAGEIAEIDLTDALPDSLRPGDSAHRDPLPAREKPAADEGDWLEIPPV